ncbi:MAG: hypothetical protein K0U66_09780 [Gammaproteobacteria bacterium]|nr:hypothetical protein [Gammaproteobacteria bacterium]
MLRKIIKPLAKARLSLPSPTNTTVGQKALVKKGQRRSQAYANSDPCGWL